LRIKWHRILMLLVVAMLAVSAGCGGDDEGSGSGTTEAAGGAEGGTLVFATASDPVVLDGSLVSDGESLRVITQIFETLVALEAGHDRARAGLAESWEADATGKV
jgi:peptide/nickel transport system substrate-binding protein